MSPWLWHFNRIWCSTKCSQGMCSGTSVHLIPWWQCCFCSRVSIVRWDLHWALEHVLSSHFLLWQETSLLIIDSFLIYQWVPPIYCFWDWPVSCIVTEKQYSHVLSATENPGQPPTFVGFCGSSLTFDYAASQSNSYGLSLWSNRLISNN